MRVSEMIEQYASAAQQPKSIPMSLHLVYEEYDEWMKEVGPSVGDLKELADLVYVIYGYARAMGYDLEGAVKRVHENNMGRMVQDDGTILRREDGKIIKNKNHPKVVLEDLV